MIWATVSSKSCFSWLYRASPSSAAKNIINLISVFTIWWCPHAELSHMFLEESVCYDQCVLLTKLLAFVLLHFVLQDKTCLLLQISLDFLLLHSPLPYDEKDIFFGVGSRRSCRSSQNIQLQLLWHLWLRCRLGLLWCWMVYLENEARSFCHFRDCT